VSVNAWVGPLVLAKPAPDDCLNDLRGMDADGWSPGWIDDDYFLLGCAQ